jgi:hypothetical protein
MVEVKMTDSKENKLGKPWKNHKIYLTYEEADKERNRLLQEGGYEAKVKKKVDDRFVVKTRIIKHEKESN